MKRYNIFPDDPYVEDAEIKQWLGLIYRNFGKCVKILIAIYGRRCVICDGLSPSFRSDSGVSEHYWIRHRKATALFVLNNLMTKKPNELEDLLN